MMTNWGLDAALRGDYYVAIQAKKEPKKQTFVDVSGKEYGSEQALRNAQKARYNQMTLELEEWEKKRRHSHPHSIHGAIARVPFHAGSRAAHRLLLRQTVLR